MKMDFIWYPLLADLARPLLIGKYIKKIVNLPGEIVECGVYKGSSAIRFATFREILESQNSRKLIAFDAFGAFPPSSLAEDKAFIKEFEDIGGVGISRKDLVKSFTAKAFKNYEFIEGDILYTVPQYAEIHKELKIALLHIDVDVYDPTRIILETLFDKIVPGGILMLDDYGTVYGETKAMDEFFARNNIKYQMEKLSFYKIPVFFIKK